jgi:hypothetical protein
VWLLARPRKRGRDEVEDDLNIMKINKRGNVLRRVHVTIVAVEKQYYIFWVYVCRLIYPACRAHAPYYIINSGLIALPYFSTLSHFRKNIIEHKMCIVFLYYYHKHT